MDNENKKRTVMPWQQAGPSSVEFPRRRLARIVHDERGRASMEWERIGPEDRDAPPRVPLAIVEDPVPAARSLPPTSSNRGCNPYDRGIETRVERGLRARSPADLRRLDALIRHRRAVEANRRSGDDD